MRDAEPKLLDYAPPPSSRRGRWWAAMCAHVLVSYVLTTGLVVWLALRPNALPVDLTACIFLAIAPLFVPWAILMLCASVVELGASPVRLIVAVAVYAAGFAGLYVWFRRPRA